jgi:hypothetical protein
MALVLADRVRDTTTTTGTGTVTLSGTAPTGYQNFSVVGNSNTTYYTINAGSQFEVGIGTYSSTGPTLSRDTVLESSNGGALVDFAAGTKDVFVTYPADKSVNQDASGNVGFGTTAPVAKVDITDQNNAGFRFAEYNDIEGAVLRVSSARGTIAAPTALLTDSVIFGLRAFGYSSAGSFGSAVVQINGRAAENFTATAQGTYLTFVTTTIGSATSAERMRITDAGNVGIGTTAPGYPLTVQASASAGAVRLVGRASDSISTLEFINSAQSGTQGFIQSIGSNLLFATGVTERMRIDSSGNVGIGTSSPAVKLDVNGSVNFGQTLISGGGVSTGDCAFELGGNRSGSGNSYIDFHSTSGTDFESRIIRYGGTNGGMDIINSGTGGMVLSVSGAAPMAFQTSGTERARITSAGFVGIGTSSPQVGLHISFADQSTNRIRLQNTGSGGGNFDIIGGLAGASNAGLSFFDVTNSATRMYIDSAGLVGIGTTSPQNKLDIVGNMLSREDTAAGANPVLLRNSNTGNNTTKSSSALFQGTDTVGTVKNIGSIGFFPDDANYIGANLRFLVRSGDAAPTEFMRIISDGSLLVGATASMAITSRSEFKSTTSGAWPLALNGNNRGLLVRNSDATSGIYAYFEYNGGTNNGQISWSGGTTSYVTTSDARVKKNIVDAPDAGSLIDNIKVRSWDFKADDVHWRYGMVAQELLPIAPEAVTVPEDEEKMMGIDYSKLVPMLIKEVQSLRARVAQLEGN